MTSSVATPLNLLTIRAHLVFKTTIVASYAVGIGRNIKVGSRIFKDTTIKNIKRAKLEILNDALAALGEGKRVAIEVEESFLWDFINTGVLKNEQHFQDIADSIRMKLSLCESVVCRQNIGSGIFNAALNEYRRAKVTAFPEPSPTYKEIFAMQKKLKEARQYEMAVMNW